MQCCVGFCHTSTWISHRYTYVPSLLNFPPTPPHPSRLSQSTRLSSLHHTTNSNWLFILYMIMYMFPCYSLHWTHALLLPLCPQVCCLCQCLHSCLTNGFTFFGEAFFEVLRSFYNQGVHFLIVKFYKFLCLLFYINNCRW